MTPKATPPFEVLYRPEEGKNQHTMNESISLVKYYGNERAVLTPGNIFIIRGKGDEEIEGEKERENRQCMY